MSFFNELIAVLAVALLAWSAWEMKIKPELARRAKAKTEQTPTLKKVSTIDAEFNEVPK